MRVYIAGPMRGRAEFNFPAFDAASAHLAALGHDIVSPADHDREQGFDPAGMTGHEDLLALGFDLRETLAWDLAQVAESDAVAVLDGWENSSGARAEVATAHALGLMVAPYDAFDADGNVDILDVIASPRSASGEVRVTAATGGQKGTKPQRYDLIPVYPLRLLAELYGKGAQKYEEHNWAKGYDWKLSYASAQRHLNEFWGGEDLDPEMQLPHVICAAFHCLTLAQFMRDYPEFDSRI